LLLNEKKDTLKLEEYTKCKSLVKIDNTDKKILKILSENANLSLVEIAKKTKLSMDVVKYRIRMLNQNVIKSYRVLWNLQKIGYHDYILKMRVRQATKHDENKLISWCSMKRNVLFCTKRIGHYDYSIDFTVKNINELNKTIAEFKEMFDYMIDYYDLVITSKVPSDIFTSFSLLKSSRSLVSTVNIRSASRNSS